MHERRPDPTELRALAAGAEATDGIAPLAEQTLLAQPGRHLVETDAGVLVGYATTGAGTGELVVAPGARRRGHGRALLAGLLTLTDRVWAHGDLPAARALAAATGLVRGRELLRMRWPTTGPLPEADWPAGVTVRPFVPGRDEPAWLALNAVAFSEHPEQGRWTAADLAARQAEPWFDPAGFFLAERDGRLVGFHWTKVEGDDGTAGDLGEVYVVGVDPAEAGAGLGRALTSHGLRHLATRVDVVVLYVDGDNARARALYERLGFTPDRIDVTYRRPVD